MLSLFIISFIVLNGCISNDQESIEYIDYINNENGFRFSYPDSWVIVLTGKNNSSVHFKINGDSPENTALVDISVREIDTNITLNEIIDDIITEIENAPPPAITIISTRITSINEYEVGEIILTYDDINYKINVKMIIFYIDTRSILVSLSSPTSWFNTYVSEFEISINSFIFI